MGGENRMVKLYRLLATILLLLVLLIVSQTIRSTWTDIITAHSQPLHCSNGICRTIQPDGSLADDVIIKPEAYR